MCRKCRARGWDLYCLEEARKADCNIPKPPKAADNTREEFVPVRGERGYYLSKLAQLGMDEKIHFDLVLRVRPEILARHPEVLTICRKAGLGLEVIHREAAR